MQKCDSNEAELKAILESLKPKLVEWQAAIAKTPITSYTTKDVKMLLTTMNIAFDNKAVQQQQVDGALLSLLESEDAVQESLGIAAFGDCTRVAKAVRVLNGGQPFT